MTDVSDVELVRAALAGDERAASALDARWRPQLFKFAMQRTGDYDTAEDITQAALVKAFTYLPSFRQDARFGTWLFTIAKNLITDRSRDHFTTRRDVAADVTTVCDRHGDADRAVIQHETRDRIDVALSKLSPGSRGVLVMACEEDRPLKEIAVLTGTNVNTVKTRIHRARRAFAAHFA